MDRRGPGLGRIGIGIPIGAVGVVAVACLPGLSDLQVEVDGATGGEWCAAVGWSRSRTYGSTGSGDGFEAQSKSKGVGYLDDGGKAGVAVRR